MTTEARDALAKALHESAGTHSRPVLTRQICPGPSYHDAEADAILAALAGWTLVPVDTVARLTESLKWPLAFPCFREDDDDCQAHAAEWPFGNDVCEWVLQARAALGASDDE
jgi:hypothetical protein